MLLEDTATVTVAVPPPAAFDPELEEQALASAIARPAVAAKAMAAPLDLPCFP